MTAGVGLRVPRLTTPAKTIRYGQKVIKQPRPPQRFCDGCKRRLGDQTRAEILCADRSIPLPSVIEECPACTPNPPGLEWRLVLHDPQGQPYDRPPLTENSRMDRWARGRIVKHLRTTACEWARHIARVPPLAVMQVDLIWTPARGNRRDEANAIPTRKALEDGLVDAGLVPDDTRQWSLPTIPIITAADPHHPSLELHVSEIQPTKEHEHR